MAPHVADDRAHGDHADDAAQPFEPSVAPPPALDVDPQDVEEQARPFDTPPEPDPATASADDDEVPDDLPESLRATSPLLARAFRATGPQRSVLSQMLLDEAD